MKGSQKFTLGFVGGFCLLLVLLFYVFRKFSGEIAYARFLQPLGFGLVFLFLLFGIILISLYLRKVQHRDLSKKN